ncbi:MAG TPA: hypothetical protein VGW40_05150 [Allosphingosinicella sp.]|nr:hypothetical protein [Allosphingosinicella sp.]
MASNDNRPARGRAAEALEAARERTSSAYEAARSRATDVTRQASEQLAVYPVTAVIGGFALGALAAALLPRTDSEEKLLGKTARRLTGAAREAAQRGIDAGKTQIEELRDKAARRVGEAVVDAVGGKS